VAFFSAFAGPAPIAGPAFPNPSLLFGRRLPVDLTRRTTDVQASRTFTGKSRGASNSLAFSNPSQILVKTGKIKVGQALKREEPP